MFGCRPDQAINRDSRGDQGRHGRRVQAAEVTTVSTAGACTGGAAGVCSGRRSPLGLVVVLASTTRAADAPSLEPRGPVGVDEGPRHALLRGPAGDSVELRQLRRAGVDGALGGVGTVLAVGLVLDDCRFASEVLFGAALGYFVGHWVVRYRSTRFAWAPAGHPVRLDAVVPLVRDGGGGVAAVLRF